MLQAGHAAVGVPAVGEHRGQRAAEASVWCLAVRQQAAEIQTSRHSCRSRRGDCLLLLLELCEAQELVHRLCVEIWQGPASVAAVALHQLHECQLLAELIDVAAAVVGLRGCCCCCVDRWHLCPAALQAPGHGQVVVILGWDAALV
jgi:hypothetical protein